MKLLELEINNTRGIRHLLITPKGMNFVVWGPNGSGKSGVVDAIDFLLTGRMTRLTGKGTGNITLAKHGPHIDCKPEEANVRAIIKLKAVGDPIEIKRCMDKPNLIECNDETRSYLDPIIALARRGQHVLTRREILRYITAEGGERAQQIQELLSITEIEATRKSLVKAQHDLEKEFENSERNLDVAKAAINATIQKPSFEINIVLDAVNQLRAVIGGAPIKSVKSAELKENVRLLSISSGEQPINISLLETDIGNLKSVISEANQEEISKLDNELRSGINGIQADHNLLRAYTQRELIQLGISLLDENGNCPLCDKPWEERSLREYLEKKLSMAQAATKYQESISNSCKYLSNRINTIRASLKKALAAVELIGLNEDATTLKLWDDNLNKLSDSIAAPVSEYFTSGLTPEMVKILIAPEKLTEIVTRIMAVVKSKYPESTPEQTAWDTLTRLEENLKGLEKAEAGFSAAAISLQRAITLYDCFEKARDGILKKIYDSIKDRFVELYKELHGKDEDNFDAKLEPEGAALNLEVGFYGLGSYPPQALHSEGHQDSMGLCLYLALAESLTSDLIDLIILDDVVMSVDADHRRELCRLLAKEFPNHQFLITTHDKNWAHQLKSEGVVSSKSYAEFYNWNVHTGPQVSNEVDLWDRIEQDLKENDVSSAAARLRRGSEEFFSTVADLLQAPVKFKINGRWELGDLMPASYNQFRSFIKRAKCAAQSWNDKETLESLNELESTAAQIFARTNAEQWAINASIHYSNWASLTKDDFRPVVDAFQDFHRLFICTNCGATIYVVNNGPNMVNIRCNCEKISFNLLENEKRL